MLQLHRRKVGEKIDLKKYEMKRSTNFGNTLRTNRVDSSKKDKK
jgi:hypothetical protein